MGQIGCATRFRAAGRVARPFIMDFLSHSELWVPRPCVFCKGGYDAAATMNCQCLAVYIVSTAHASALYHLFVLPAVASLPHLVAFCATGRELTGSDDLRPDTKSTSPPVFCLTQLFRLDNLD